MVFWCRIRPTRFEYFSHQCKKWYSRVYGVTSIDRILCGRIRVLKGSESYFHQRPTEQYVVSRFFAAPVQAKPKPEAKDQNGPRLNRAITADFVRLVTDEGHGIVSRREALDRAMKLNLDLVEVQRNAKPPVCKIMDFHKEKYKLQVKEKDSSKGKSQVTLRKGDCKEVRFTGKIEQKDLQIKAEMIKRLMERGYRVKCMAMGKEDEDLGAYLSRLSALIDDVAFVESGPRVEKKQAFVIVRHTKFGPPKKNPGKKISTIMAATTPSTINSSRPVQMPLQTQEEYEPVESGSNMEDEFLSDQEVHTQNSIETPITTPMEVSEGDADEKIVWSAFDVADDFEKVFNFDDNGSGTTPRFADGPIDGLDPLSPPEATDIMDLLNKKPSFSGLIGSSTSSQQHVGPPAKPVLDSIISKLGSGNGQAGGAFSLRGILSHSEPSFSGENQNPRKIDLKNRFHEPKSTERISGVTESKIQVSEFSYAAQKGVVNNDSPGSEENSPSRRWQPQSGFNTTKSLEPKLPSTDNSSLRTGKSTERISGVTESKIQVSEFSYAAQKGVVNNDSPGSEQNSPSRRWQPQSGFNATKSLEPKLPSTDNSGRTGKSTERISGVTESKIQVSEFSYAAQKGVVNNGSPGSEQNSPSRRWQPQPGFNATKSLEPKLPSTDNSSLRNLKLPPIDENQKNIDGNQGKPSSSYGIFSIPKTAAFGDQRSSWEMNGDKERNPIKFTKLPNSSGISSDPNTPKSKVDVQRQDTGKTKQGGWGVFSQTEVRR